MPATGHPVLVIGLQFSLHMATPAIEPPIPSFSVRTQSPPGAVHSASESQYFAQVLTVFEVWMQIAPAAQSMAPVQTAPTAATPAVAHTRPLAGFLIVHAFPAGQPHCGSTSLQGISEQGPAPPAPELDELELAPEELDELELELEEVVVLEELVVVDELELAPELVLEPLLVVSPPTPPVSVLLVPFAQPAHAASGRAIRTSHR